MKAVALAAGAPSAGGVQRQGKRERREAEEPERSVSVDCGATGTIGPLALDAGYFSITTRDRIVWTPGSGGIWSPENIARVRSDGFETEIRWSAFQGSLQLAANSSWITATKESEDYPGDSCADAAPQRRRLMKLLRALPDWQCVVAVAC